MLAWTLVILLFYNTALLLKYCGDFIILKTRLQYYQPINAKIVDVDYIQYIKGQIPVTIVSFQRAGKVRDTAITYRKNDKVGDELEIVTDGFCTVRKKHKFSVFAIMLEELGMIIGSVCLGFIANKLFGEISFLIVAVVVMVCFVVIVCYPIYTASYNQSLEKRLGWHEYLNGNEIQQQTDDWLLIAVAIGAIVIMMISVCLITNA